ncbi:hypothetical protein CLAIMM_00132 [Cladophialophora immunda]|nr:hypothetical protein CLAIMM_00132 [Cladophialophora immunda]
MLRATDPEPQRHYQGRLVRTVAGIAWGAISYAYVASIIGTTLGQPSFISYMGLDTNPNATALIGALTSLFYAGGALGSVLNSFMADRWGRKVTLTTASIILIISEACLAGSVNIAMFITFRFFVGVGAFMQYVGVPLWVIEISPPRGRSILGGIVGLFGVIGYIMGAYVGVGFFYYQTSSDSQWRVPLALGCVSPVLLLCLMPWLPESPRWLLARGQEKRAWDIVSRLHRREKDSSDEYAMIEFTQMKKQHELEASLDSSWWEVIRRPSYRKRAALAFFLPPMVFTTGNLVLTTYASSLFVELGYDAETSLQLLAGTYVAAIAGNLISLTYVDRIPRNIIFTVGILADTVILSIEAALVAEFLGSGNDSALRAAVAFFFLFLFTFNLFLEGPQWYYASEIFPTHLRAKGITISVVGVCCIDILWLMLAPTAFANIGWKFYMVFISLSVCSAFVVYFCYPNTLHKPLEEVAHLFGDEDLVAVYQKDIRLEDTTSKVVEISEECTKES